MDSFSIKYEIDDLCEENNCSNGLENNQDEIQIKEKNNCICLRLAKLFSDLLKKEKSTKNGRNLKSRDSSTSSCTSIRASKAAPISSNVNNREFFQSEFEIINKELKLIREGQNELLDKYDLIFKRMSSKLFFPRKTYNSHTNYAQKQPAKRFASKSDLDDCNKKKIYSSKQTLIGAKKRKFNNATLNPKSRF